jgi:hypothetical protein
MKHDLLGYVLDVLEEDERQQVEELLAESAEARCQVVALREAVQPLSYDLEEAEPPSRLFANTLMRVAQLRCRRVRPLPPSPARVSVRSGWRPVNVLVAACIAFVLFLIAAPALLYARHQYHVVACADNLRHFHAALMQYSQEKDGYLPAPERKGPFSAAGYYAVALRDAGLWDESMHAVCPASRKSSAPSAPPPTRDQLQNQCLSVMPNQLDSVLAAVGGGYGYHLGYEENGQFHAIRRTLGDETPVMADRPPRQRETSEWRRLNSPNHGGAGQNVLFLGGHVRFLKQRAIGPDDLYLNAMQRLAAGCGPLDAVIGPGEARPYPDEE